MIPLLYHHISYFQLSIKTQIYLIKPNKSTLQFHKINYSSSQIDQNLLQMGNRAPKESNNKQINRIQKQEEAAYLEEKIIQNQQLFKIEDEQLHELMHRSIGALTFLNRHKHFGVGTGVLLSQDLVLTAAHNIYAINQKTSNTDFQFYIGANGTAEEYYEVEGVKFLEQYKTCSQNSRLVYDFALLKLKRQVPFYQFMKIACPCLVCLKQNKPFLQIFGFPRAYQNYLPLDKFGKKIKLSQYGLAKNNRIVEINAQRCQLRYGISTLPGQSGSPVIINNQIIGMHIGGGKEGKQYNFGRINNIELVLALNKWSKQFKASPIRVQTDNLCTHLMHYRQNYKASIQTSIVRHRQQLKSIKLSNHFNLTSLNLAFNCLKEIDLSSSINLTYLDLSSNLFKQIDINANRQLLYLNLSINRLAEINLQQNVELLKINLAANSLIYVDLSKNSKLTTVNLNENKLTTMNFIHNKELTSLSLWKNYMKNINLASHSLLYALDLEGNHLQLIAIHISSSISLAQYMDYHFDLSNQQASQCVVRLFCSSQDGQKCKQIQKLWMDRYSKDGNDGQFGTNRHKCSYDIITIAQ